MWRSDATRLPRRALWLLGAGLLLLLSMGGGSLLLLRQSDRFAGALKTLQEAQLNAVRILDLLQDAETGQRGYLLTGKAAYLQPYTESATRIGPMLEELGRSPAMAPLAARQAELMESAQDKMRELASTIALQAQGRHADAIGLVQTDVGNRLMTRARDAVRAISGDLNRRRAGERARLARLSLGLEGAIWGGLAAILLCAGAAVTLVRRGWAVLTDASLAMQDSNRTLEIRVRERTAALASANEEVQRFAYIVSHDLRAPLVNVMGFTAELEAALKESAALLSAAEERMPAHVPPGARLAITADIPEALGFIRASTGRMDRLINAILSLSREGRRTLKPERLEMTPLVGALAAGLHRRLEAVGGRIEAGVLPDVVSDRLAIEQIFSNLLDNAVKYLLSGRPGIIRVRGVEEAGQVLYAVRDNGRGIEEKDRARVFELFRRAGRQDTAGEGIGLAHARGLALRLGGSLDFASTFGEGTEFILKLPKTPIHGDHDARP